MSSSRSLGFIALLTILLFVVSCAITITEEQKVTYTTNQSGAGAVAWSPAGRYFAVANHIGIWVYSTATLEEITVLTSPAPDVSPAVEEDSPPEGGSETGGGSAKFNLRHGWGNSLLFLDEQRIATTGMGAGVTVWNIDVGEVAETYGLEEDEGFAISLSYFPPTGDLAVGTSKGLVILVQPGQGTAPRKLMGAEGLVQDLQFSRDGAYLGAVGAFDELVIWGLEDLAVFDRLPTAPHTMEIEQMGKPGEFLLAGDTIEIWNYIDQEDAGDIAEPNLAGQKTGWFILDVLSWMPIPQQENIVPCKRAVAVSPDGRMLADMHPGALKEVIRIIALPSQEVIETLNPLGGMTCDLRFSPDGQFLLIANQRGAHVYDTTTWEVKRLKLSSI
jgi:WD40 repeat protein